MEPWEIMISESQERMIAIVREPMLEAVEAVLDRWELHHAVVGEVTDTGELRAFWDDEPVGEIPARFLTEECPRYDLLLEPRPASPPSEIADPPAVADALRALLGSPNIRSRAFVYRRYDQLVGSQDRSPPGPRRGCASAAAVHARARGQPRRPGPDRPPRPETGRRARGPRGRAQRRVRGRRADRLHELPQLRQSGEARDRLGALGGDRGHVRRVPRARRADRVRQRLALQRDKRARDPPDARRRRGGARAGRAPRPEGVARGRFAVRRGRVSALARGLRAAGAASAEVGGSPAQLDLEAEARLVTFLWRAAPLLHACARRSRGRARRVPRRSRAPLGPRRADRIGRRPGRALRRGRRASGARPARRRTRTSSAISRPSSTSRCAPSAPPEGLPCSEWGSTSSARPGSASD